MDKEYKNMQKVTSFYHGFSNSWIRHPYTLAVLECGHLIGGAKETSEYKCHKCGKILGQWTCEELSAHYKANGKTYCCGLGSCTSTLGKSKSQHEPENFLYKIGDEVDCSECNSMYKSLDHIKEVKSQIHHGRFMPNGGRESLSREGRYLFYRHDSSSPSGFMLLCGVIRHPVSDKALTEMGLSPLSPTEAP